ncbi:MAG: hypothetical protein CFH19_00740 [Alphaproteobacteria bacterium MarineAlpha5_Bin9]|nr:MAG: hypothetical protein CFH19_00740 [Alphaproteobacteria bacterium MarineAlpha5_Bin9]
MNIKANIINILILSITNIVIFYYAVQLLVFTDEFSYNNLGSFNHAIAGLSEIIGIIFLCFSFSLLYIKYTGIYKQEPLLYTIFLVFFLIASNLWRYVFTDSPGESNINIILINATIFTIISLLMLILIIILKFLNK